jgi:hypothetical protein
LNGALVVFGQDGNIYLADWAKESDFWASTRPMLVVQTNEKPKGTLPGATPPEYDDMAPLRTHIPRYILEYTEKFGKGFFNPSLPTIATITLPRGIKGTFYYQTLNTFETSEPITWTIESGSLPDGLSFSTDGKISGTLISENIFDFTIKATNSAGYDTQTLRINVSQYDEQDEQDEQDNLDKLDKLDAGSGGGCNVGSGFFLILLSAFLLLI